MKRQRKDFDLCVADWKDVPTLLENLRQALDRRGLSLQVHDLGSDDWVVTVAPADTDVTQKDVYRHIRGED